MEARIIIIIIIIIIISAANILGYIIYLKLTFSKLAVITPMTMYANS